MVGAAGSGGRGVAALVSPLHTYRGAVAIAMAGAPRAYVAAAIVKPWAVQANARVLLYRARTAACAAAGRLQIGIIVVVNIGNAALKGV